MSYMPLTPYTNEAPRLRGAEFRLRPRRGEFRLRPRRGEFRLRPHTTEADIRYFETEEFELAWKEITWSWSPEMSLILLFFLTTPTKYGMI